MWRFVLRTPWSALMTLVGITLGVTSIVAVHLISVQVSRQLDTLIPAPVGEFTHVLYRDGLTGADYFALRRHWRMGDFDFVQRLAPIIDEHTVRESVPLHVIGVDLLISPLMPDVVQDTDNGSIDWRGVWVDESLRERVDLPINGIVEAPPGTLLADIGVAQELLGWQGDRLSYVAVGTVDPLRRLRQWLERLLPGVDAGWPARSLPQIAGWRSGSLAEAYPANQFGRSVLFNVGALGALALLVAWLLIYQVAVAWLRRLWGVFERLHILGVDHRTLRNHFLLMLCAFGCAAGVGGLLLGHTLAALLYRAVMTAPATSLPVDAWLVTKAVSSALLVCALGGWWAYRQNQQASQWPIVIRGFVVATALACLLLVIVDERAGLVGAFVGIAILSWGATVVVGPGLNALRTHAARLGGSYLLRMTLRELVWYPRDLSVAIGGLALALATAVGVGVMVDSFRADFSQMLDRRLAYDWHVEGGPVALESLRQTLVETDEVSRVQAYRSQQLRVRDVTVEVVATRLDLAEARRYGLSRALGAGEALIGEQTARLLKTRAGDEVEFGGKAYRIAGVFQSFGDLRPRIIVNSRSFTDGALQSISFNLAPGRQAPSAGLQAAVGDLQWHRQNELRAEALRTFDRTFAITTILIAIAILVAAIGVYIALTSLRLNQRISSRLLADMGVNRLENWGVDLARGLGIGACAIVIALPVGLAFGWILCHLVNPRAFGWTVHMRVEAMPLLWPVVWGLAASALAGMVRVGRQEEGAVGG